MLHLSFQQFRCWENLSIDIPLGSITLVKGKSGCGKSTILQGIIWCLYGNLRLVAPNQMENSTKSKAKTQVIVELPFNFNCVDDILSITRQKNPNQLIVTHNKQIYEDKTAQSIIDDLFGTYDIWMASCYIGQGCRNTFLTAANTGKMELLNSIAFHEEDPNVYIERIDNRIMEIDSVYKTKLAIFTNNLNTLQTILSTIDINLALTALQVTDINTKIVSMTNEVAALQIVKRQRDINLGILNNLHHQHTQLPSILIPTPNHVLVELCKRYTDNIDHLDYADSLEIEINTVKDIVALLRRRDDLRLEISNIHNELLSYNNSTIYTISDYDDAIFRESTYRDNQRLAQILNIDYDADTICKTISCHRITLASQERLKFEADKAILIQKLTCLEADYLNMVSTISFPDIIPKPVAVPDYSIYDTQPFSQQLTELFSKLSLVETEQIKQVNTLQDIIANAILSPDYSKYDTCELSQQLQVLSSKLTLQPDIPSSSDDLEQQLTALSSKLTLEPDISVPIPDYSSYDTTQLCRQLVVLSDKLNMEPDINVMIPDYTKYDTSNLSSQSVELGEKLNTIHIDAIIIPVPDYAKYDTQSLSHHLSELSKQHGALTAHIDHLYLGHDVLQCPQCTKPLRYQQGTLIIADTEPINHDKINIAKAELDAINFIIKTTNDEIQNLLALEKNDRLMYEIAISTEQKRVDMAKQEYIGKINAEIVQINRGIQELKVAENEQKLAYERGVATAKQEYISKINTEIAQINRDIQKMKTAENDQKLAYERLVAIAKQEYMNKINCECSRIQTLKDNEQRRVSALKQDYTTKINGDIAKINRNIQFLLTAERNERLAYERLVSLEQKRVDDLREKNRLLQLEEQRQNQVLKQQRIDAINTDITKMNQHIQSLMAAEKNARTAYDNEVIFEQKRLDDLRQQIKKLEVEQRQRDIAKQVVKQQIDDCKNDVERLTTTISVMPEIIGVQRLLTFSEVEQIHELINKLSSICIVQLPDASSQHIKKCLDYQEMAKKRDTIISTCKDHIEMIPLVFRDAQVNDVLDYINKLGIYWKSVKDATIEKTRIDLLRLSLDGQIAEITSKLGDDPSNKIDDMNKQIILLKDALILSEKAHEAIKFHNQVTKERQDVMELNTLLGDLQTLKQYAIETECRILDEVVTSINSCIDEVCSTLFDRDISIVLNLFKTLKTNKITKPMANFAISYQGGVFDSINQMSGGEGDRASIALTLALKKLSLCPLMMLDETLASLDLDIKEDTIKTIRENTNDTVLIIMHDGIEGIFDNTLDLDEITEGRY